jgi:hypothetical protein
VKITIDEILEDDFMQEIAEDYIKEQVEDIKAGKNITQSYKPSTIKRRQQFGLQAGHVDLSGSTSYSGKSWRLLDKLKVLSKTKLSVDIVWSTGEAARLASYIKNRFGSVFK